MSIQVDQKPMGFLRHNQITDVTITSFTYDIKNLIMMEKADGLLVHFNSTCIDKVTERLGL